MIPNIPPKLFSFSAVAVGYLLIDDATANEQNAMGNWLMLLTQVLSTNAFYRQVMQERRFKKIGSTESRKKINNGNRNKEETIIMIEKMIKALEQELDELKKTN